MKTTFTILLIITVECLCLLSCKGKDNSQPTPIQVQSTADSSYWYAVMGEPEEIEGHTKTVIPAEIQAEIDNTINIGIHCGIAGATDKEAENFKQWHTDKNYSIIKAKLMYGSDLEKVLAAVVVMEYMKKQVISLYPEEEKALLKIKHSKKPFNYCETCTGHAAGEVADIFKKPEPNTIWIASPYEGIKRYVFSIYE